MIRFRIADLLMMLAFGALGMVIIGQVQCGHQGTATQRYECEDRLLEIYQALKDCYTEERHELPNNASTVLEYLCSSGVLEAPILRCPSESPNSVGYLFTPTLSGERLFKREGLPAVVVCDRPGNHKYRNSVGGSYIRDGVPLEEALLLIEDGFVFLWIGDSNAYREWCDSFRRYGAAAGYPPGMSDKLKGLYGMSSESPPAERESEASIVNRSKR